MGESLLQQAVNDVLDEVQFRLDHGALQDHKISWWEHECLIEISLQFVRELLFHMKTQMFTTIWVYHLRTMKTFLYQSFG